MRRCLILLWWLTMASGEAADPVTLALRALHMTPADLAFKKDHVEAEWIAPKARGFLAAPLTLPAHAAATLESLRSVSNLVSLVGAPSPPVGAAELALPGAPAPVAAAAQRIYSAATVAAALLAEALPADRAPAFAAWAVATLKLDKDPAELAAWDRQGMDTRLARTLLARDDRLELQDGELAQMILAAGDQFDAAKLRQAVALVAAAVDEAVAGLRTNQFAAEFHLEFASALGPIILGGAGRNIYTNEAFLIVDTGGDDRYENSAGGANGLAGRPVAIVIDLAGNDEYVARHSVAQGAGLFGVGLLVDGGGDDMFVAKHLAQGAGLFGAGILAAGPGRQTFAADSVAQGAASFGLGMLWQRGGDTTYRANQMAQGFGSVAGRGLLLDTAGNDLYYAGGHEACPWLPGQYFSLAQGFGYGLRPFAGGGTGILGDLTGDDRYVADVYGQGASYWYAVGMLLDGAGHDAYQLYQYGQGAGIHLSSGVLLDAAGNDQYSAQAIAQGGAHDYSVGVLWDRAGDDRYSAASTAQGAALNNSFALLRDDAGDDFYAGRDPRQTQAAGHDGGKREYGAVALLLDLGGADVYSQGQTNNLLWLKPWHGAGLDTEGKQGTLEEWRGGGVEDWPRGKTARRTYRPVDAQHPVERLLRRAISDKPDAGQAWAELKQSGPAALPYLLSRLDSPSVLVQAKTEELIDHLGTNAIPFLIAGLETAPNDEVARLCCYFLARFEAATNTIPRVLPLLARDKTRPVALYTLGHLRARAAVAPAVAALREERELVRLRAAQALGRIGDRQAVPALLAALDDEFWTVRYAAQDALVALGRSSRGPLRGAWAKAPPRARPHLLDALAKLGDPRAVAWAEQFYAQDDPVLRTARRNQLRALLAAVYR